MPSGLSRLFKTTCNKSPPLKGKLHMAHFHVNATFMRYSYFLLMPYTHRVANTVTMQAKLALKRKIPESWTVNSFEPAKIIKSVTHTPNIARHIVHQCPVSVIFCEELVSQVSLSNLLCLC